jgi:LPXTG-motif cell wall-anchored protein
VVTVSDSTFSNAEVTAAIYAEGNLTVSDSTFENLTSYSGGAAIQSQYTSSLVVSNSTFRANKSVGQGQGGTINSQGPLTVSNSTFDSNESDFQGGAIYALGGESKLINNSTFVGNSATTDAAVHLSEGGVIANSTFWNNGDSDTYSIGAQSPSVTYLFANILANDTPNTVKLIDPNADTVDLGANLYTDDSFNDVTNGEGSSKLVTASELKLSALASSNAASTKTAAIAADSVAYDYYTADSDGINPTAGGVLTTLLAADDQKGADRPLNNGYDVGAYESGEKPDPSASETPETTETEDSESLADTGLETTANSLGLIGVGLAAMLGGSIGLVIRRRKV